MEAPLSLGEIRRQVEVSQNRADRLRAGELDPEPVGVRRLAWMAVQVVALIAIAYAVIAALVVLA